MTLTGCVPSWNSFYEEKDLIFDNALVGAWRPVHAEANSRETWSFTKNGDKAYQLQQTDEQGRRATFETRLFQLNGQRFLDLYLIKVEGDELKLNAWASFSLVPAHLLLKVERIEPSLKLAAMNPDWIRKHLEQHSETLAHRKVSNGSVVLAASTSELQKFILAHQADELFFGGPMELKHEEDTLSIRAKRGP